MTLAAPAPAAARTATCPLPGCISIADPAPRKDWENPGFCAKHRQQARQRAGACLNCGGELEAVPETNLLTGRQLRRDGELVDILVCAERCGYSRRPRPARRRV